MQRGAAGAVTAGLSMGTEADLLGGDSAQEVADL
jgi:hypothetical protein